MAKGRGVGKTPERVVKLVSDAVALKSQSAIARDSGLALLTIQRFLKGIGEPSQETLEKLSNYFKVSPPWLRGEGERSLEQERWFYNWERLSPEERAETYVGRKLWDVGGNKALFITSMEFGRRFSILEEKYGDSFAEQFLKLPPDERQEVIEYLTLIKDISAAGDKLGVNITFMGEPTKDE